MFFPACLPSILYSSCLILLGYYFEAVIRGYFKKNLGVQLCMKETELHREHNTILGQIKGVSHPHPRIPVESLGILGLPVGWSPMESTGTLQGLCDHIWQYQQICRCYISSGTIFQWEFNGAVHCVIGVTICGNTGKYASVIYHLEPFFNVNSMVMSIA